MEHNIYFWLPYLRATEQPSHSLWLISELCQAAAENVEPLHRISHTQPLLYFDPSIFRFYATLHDDFETIPAIKSQHRMKCV